MKKNKLKTGMRVKHRNESVGIIIRDNEIIAYDKGFNLLKDIQENLEMDKFSAGCDDPEDWDIIEVFEGFEANSNFLDPRITGHSIWKREDKTPEQIQLDTVMDRITELTNQANVLKDIINKGK